MEDIFRLVTEDMRGINIYTILLRVVLALVIGGVIGIERGRKNQPAGFRTYMLVCLGATLVMMTNQYIYISFSSSGDISRLGAQVISGIGFLGAGTILVTKKNQVRGLTTAAGLWTAACVGLAIGIGFYEGAIVVGIAIFLIMTFFHKVEGRFRSHSAVMSIYLNLISLEAVTGFVNYCREKEHKVSDMQISKDEEAEGQMIVLIASLKLKKGIPHVRVIEEVSKLEGVRYIEEL